MKNELPDTSSNALQQAAEDLRNKHRGVLELGAKRFHSSVLTSVEELDELSTEVATPFVLATDKVDESSASPVVMRRRSRQPMQYASKRASMPATDSLVCLRNGSEQSRQFSTQRQRPLSWVSHRHSLSSMSSAGSKEDLLKEFLHQTMKSRRQDEEIAAADRERYESILKMSTEYGISDNARRPSSLIESRSESNLVVIAPSNASSSRLQMTADKRKSSEVLKNLWDVDEVEQRISDIEEALGSSRKKLDVDKALLEAKLTAERKFLFDEEKNCEKIKDCIIQMEEQYMIQREKYQDALREKSSKLQEMKKVIEDIQTRISKTPESLRESIEEELKKEEEKLQDEVKEFENEEFSILEALSQHDVENEEKQKDLILTKKKLDRIITVRKNRITSLNNEMAILVKSEMQRNQRLMKDRDVAIGLLQKQRNDINHMELQDRVGKAPFRNPSSALNPNVTHNKRKLTSIDNFIDSLSVHSSSSQQEVVSNYSEAESSPLRSSYLLRKSQNEDQRSQSIYSVQSYSHQEIKRSNSNLTKRLSYPSQVALGTGNSISPSNDQVFFPSKFTKENYHGYPLGNRVEDERLKEVVKLFEEALAKKQMLLNDVATDASRDALPSLPLHNLDKPQTPKAESPSTPENANIAVALRTSTKTKRQTRPMSRYLPVRSGDFDLRAHIEACGHNPSACNDTILTATSCSGYLLKKKESKNSIIKQKKRWFVFDRTSKSLIYYKKKSETKEKGRISFESIEDIFSDHLKALKGPNPFCVKCSDRVHYFSAPSSEAMRIWMDVLVTGAEGYREYMKTIDQQKQ